MNLTIQDFWKKRLAPVKVQDATPVRGWSFEKKALATFKEAPLTVDEELSNRGDEDKSDILLVSAPGAVGKSTLARQIALETGAVYVDLANTDPVGGNTLSGGLAKSKLISAWDSETTTVLIDGLDEARIRVTQEAFEAFLKDVAELSKDRTVPITLFGRTGAVQDAWLLLDGHGAKVAVLEIGFYDEASSIDFANTQLRALRPGGAHADAERRAITLLLSKLREQTESDGDRFAGYAPVLRAVAERVAGVGNAAALIAEIEKGERPVTLQTVVTAILDRERGKLTGLHFDDQNLNTSLYSPEEQLDRLVARLYQLPLPRLPLMSAKDAQTYSTALQNWVPEHPFLDGGQNASSAVFDAVISTHALKTQGAMDVVVQRELQKGVAANPFLSEFYIPDHGSSELFLPPAHVGILYSSLRARLSLGDTASLSIEGPDDAEEEEALRAEVEITLARRDSERPRTLRFDSEQTGTLRLGVYLEDIEIDAPLCKVEIGPGPEAVLIAPISIQCNELMFSTEKVTAETSMGKAEAAIYLEAQSYSGAQVIHVPTARGNVSLKVSWPGAQGHPWTTYASDPHVPDDPRISEALRRFRKFIISFRSHSKGNLARFRAKLEHARMTKGSGNAILELLVSDKILTLSGSMYYLDPDRLGKITGATYVDCMSRNFGDGAISFVRRVLK
jgi:hypothetical protein